MKRQETWHWMAVAAIAAAGSALAIFFFARLSALAPAYLEGSVRSDLLTVLRSVSETSGWGLPNYRLERVRCGEESCLLRLGFRHYAPPDRRLPDEMITVRWKRGEPEGYVLE